MRGFCSQIARYPLPLCDAQRAVLLLDRGTGGMMAAIPLADRPQPPANIEAEQGSTRRNPHQQRQRSQPRRRASCLPEHFANARCMAASFAAIGGLVGARARRPMPSWCDADARRRPGAGALSRGRGAVSRQARSRPAVTIVNAGALRPRLIVEAAERRALLDIGHAVVENACDPAVPLAEVLPRALQGSTEFATPHGLESDLRGRPGRDLPAPERPWRVRALGTATGRRRLLTGERRRRQVADLGLQLQVAASDRLASGSGLPVEPCRSIGIYAEDEQEELHRRLLGIIELTGAPVDALRDMHWRSVISDQAELVEVDARGAIQPTAYFRCIERATLDFGARLLILDAVTNLFGGDEIKRRQVNAFVGLLRQLAIKMDGAVVLLGHPSAAGIATGSGLSGSTHWHNAVRSRLYLARTTGDDADPDERTLTKLKANYAGIGDVLRLRWQRGGFVALDPPSGIDRAALSAKADRVFRALLTTTYEEGTWTSPNPSARNYAPTVFAKRLDREGLGKPAFEAALFRLSKAGGIRKETYGRPSEPRTRLAPA